jgi:glutamate-5-semialdehyde dehydrogenase
MSAKPEAMTIEVPAYMQAVGQRARAASRVIGRAETRQKNAALLAIADAIEAARARRA